MSVYRLEDVAFEHRGPHGRLPVLAGLDLAVAAGELVAVVGPSGAGKSTLLHIMAGLRPPDRGTVTLLGESLGDFGSQAAARVRARHVGMVFQAFHLLSHLTALENVALPLSIAGRPRREALRRAGSLLRAVGLESRGPHQPARLSGGEQQRVAVARALANDPEVILADEPTGDLDRASTETVARLLADQAARGRTVVVATHDDRVAAIADRVLTLPGGGEPFTA